MSRLYIAGKTAIHTFSMDLNTGGLTEIAHAVEQDTAGSFMALSADGKSLYSIANGSKGAAAFSVDKTSGQLSFINSVTCDLSGGAHIATVSDGSAGVVLTAAYGAGGVNMVKIRSDGGLQEVETGASKQHGVGSNVYQPARGNEQEQAHPHSCFVDSSGKWALVSDLGQDKVYVYSIDISAGKLTEHHVVNTSPGAGPRHMCFHPTNKWVYGINELDNTINVYAFSPGGTVVGNTLQTISTLPEGYNNRDHSNAKNANGEPASGPNRPEQTSATADIHITPDGRFVYGSNRGHDSIVCYAVGSDGLLKLENFTFVRGEHPRAFSIHPSGKWLLVANQDSNNVVVFKLDPSSGALTFSGTEVNVKSARCIKWQVEESGGLCSIL